MTREEAKRELQSYVTEMLKRPWIRQRIKELEADIAAVKTTTYGEEIHGGGSDRLESLIDRLWKLKTELADRVLTAERLRSSVERKLEMVDFPYSEVLRRRYLLQQSYERIAVDMSSDFRRNYSYEYVKVLHGRGITQYAGI